MWRGAQYLRVLTLKVRLSKYYYSKLSLPSSGKKWHTGYEVLFTGT